MNVVHAIACGIDVHKRSLTACLLCSGAPGKKTVKQIRSFSTMTYGLEELRTWLAQAGCRHVAIESTGVFWRPVHNILEAAGVEVILVNAQHVKNVPGRKTDVKDAEWIAELLRHGLLRASFVPPAEIRDLRALTRCRTTLVRQRADECNRIQKLLETCNIKLASVATDVLGVSGTRILQALVQGVDDPATLAELAKGRLRAKIPQLVEALRGQFSPARLWLLQEHLKRVEELEAAIARVSDEIAHRARPFEEVLARLEQIPGVNRRIAEIIVAEIGVDMAMFPTAGHLASWAGLCPGHNQTGGKNRSGRTRHGCSWLRAALIEAGWAAARHNNGFLSARYHRIARRRGPKRACVAVGHTILRIAHHLLSASSDYQDLGADYFERVDKKRIRDGLIRRLRSLGYEVTLETEDPAA
jgi:transposase